ncbi:MAG: hypothetical protein K9K68_01655 [Methylococcaceae bacterium]|nr:hypothetical protein [Methylococcaceae bacterium]
MKKQSLILICMTVLGISGSSAIAAGTDHLKIKSAEAEWEGLEVETNVAIPIDGKSGAFGFGALTDGTNNVLVLTTHLPIDDSRHEQAPSGFHTHVLDLKAPGSAFAGANFEVDLEGSAKNSAFDANYVWSIKGNKVEVEKVPASNLGDAGVESGVSFTIQPILDAQKNPINLCVTVIDQI